MNADELLGLDIRLEAGRELKVTLALSNGEVPITKRLYVQQEAPAGGWRSAGQSSPWTHGEKRIDELAQGPVFLRVLHEDIWHEAVVPAGLADWEFVIHPPQPITVTWAGLEARPRVRFRDRSSVQPEWPGLTHGLDGDYLTEQELADQRCILMAAPGTYRIELGTANDTLASRIVRVEPGQPATVTFAD